MNSFHQKIAQLLRRIANRLFVIRPDSPVAHERFGSGYGGWDVVTRGFGRDSVIYSFGVGEDVTFDTGLIRRFGCTVHAFDPTPRSIDWVRRQDLPGQFILHEYGLAAADGEIILYPPDNPEYVSHTLVPGLSARPGLTVPVKSLRTILRELGHPHIDVLKMDIEGAEYDVITDLVQSGIRPGQILVEFHHRFPGVGIRKTRRAVGQLRSMGYGIFSVCKRNEEVGFLRKISL